MRLVEFKTSTRTDKRYMAIFQNPEWTVHFGTKHRNTYIDHGNTSMRDNYVMRNRPFPGVTEEGMNMMILWGPTSSVEGNLANFLRLMRIMDER
jgi:hypothetical protein